LIRTLAAIALVGGQVLTGEVTHEIGTVVIDGNRVTAVGRDVAVPDGARVIDATGAVITPGLIDVGSRLGVADLSTGVPTAIEATLTSSDPIRAGLRAVDTFNPDALPIPVARAGGITSALVFPTGGVISGQAAWVDFTDSQPVRRRSAALVASVRASGSSAGSRSHAFLRLKEALEDARLFRANRGPYITRKLRELAPSTADLEALARALDRDLRVVIEVDRASDIRTVLALVKQHRLDAVLYGVEEGWVVRDEIARARIPVFVDPTANLPRNWDSLRSRGDNAVLLRDAGVRVAFTTRGAVHLAHRLRYLAGNAVAVGYPYEAAVAAITREPASIFGIGDAGVLKPGALANIVVWNGDPLEPTTWPLHVFVRGREADLQTRQDLLTERYNPKAPAEPAEPAEPATPAP